MYPCIKKMGVETLKRGDNLPRLKSEESKILAAKSHSHFGMLKPPVYNVRTERLLSLPSIVEAARDSGVKKLDVWCVDLSPEQEEAAMLMLNSHFNEFNFEHVAAALKKLKAAGFDLRLTGFTEAQIIALTGTSDDWSPKPERQLDGESAEQAQLL